ncbi:uncharacterized protein LOC108639684 [Manacus vitellinus]|uniref:uncharacterized protein LOC108639684 n=1 Tax=Manacus vitellinus TaxID=328815 RepID=UPI0008462EE6|nr:uncharacterized protein LOC108639684 [Manacus vitellinus]XP_017928259.1 uncharacterized protein LOC108639684 [Manacus vitellinus]
MFGMCWEGATGIRDIPTFPAVSFPTITWNIPLPASRGTRNPRDSIPGLSRPLGATQTPLGMFIIPGKASLGTSFPLFPSRDWAPIPLGMRISCRYSGIFSLLGTFFPSKSWINPRFSLGMGSFRSSLVFWEEGITGKSLFPPLVREYPKGIVASQRFGSTQIPFSIGINSPFPSPSWIKARIGIRQGLEFRWDLLPAQFPGKLPPLSLILAPEFPFPFPLFPPGGRRMIPFSRYCNSRNSEISQPWEWFGGFSRSCCFSWEFWGGFLGILGGSPAFFPARLELIPHFSLPGIPEGGGGFSSIKSRWE